MPTYDRSWNEAKYLKRIAEGRGTGEYASYRPWLNVMDVTSRGRSSRVPGLKSGRIHHFLSWNETAYFYILDHSINVLDIREQYPLLGIETTLRIADEAKIIHPRDTKSKYPYVLTTDFVVLTTDGLKARSVKEEKELANKRVRQKLELERRYWLERGIDYKLVTEKQIDYQKAKNIEWARRGMRLGELLPDEEERIQVSELFMELYNQTDLPISQIASKIECSLGYAPGLGITIFQYLLINHLIDVNLSDKICTTVRRVQ